MSNRLAVSPKFEFHDRPKQRLMRVDSTGQSDDPVRSSLELNGFDFIICSRSLSWNLLKSLESFKWNCLSWRSPQASTWTLAFVDIRILKFKTEFVILNFRKLLNFSSNLLICVFSTMECIESFEAFGGSYMYECTFIEHTLPSLNVQTVQSNGLIRSSWRAVTNNVYLQFTPYHLQFVDIVSSDRFLLKPW